MLGAFFAICSAATFGFNSATVRRGVLTGTVFQAMAITVPIGVPLFVIAALLTGQIGAVAGFSWQSFAYLGLAGILHFVWGRYWNYRAVKEMGANLSGAVQQVSLIAALVFAMIFLGEKLTALRLLGIILVVGGPLLMTARRSKPKGKSGGKDEGFQPNVLAGWFAALMATLGYGMSPTLVRAGLAEGGGSLAGGVISYTAATLAFALVLFIPGRLVHVLSVDRGAARWFTVSGVFVFFAQMFRYLALSIAPVTVVTPIQRLSIVFRILLSTVINRKYEVFDWRVVVGMLISLAGALALSFSVDVVAEFFGLPSWFRDWQWP